MFGGSFEMVMEGKKTIRVCPDGRFHLFYPGITLPFIDELKSVSVSTFELLKPQPITAMIERICIRCGKRKCEML